MLANLSCCSFQLYNSAKLFLLLKAFKPSLKLSSELQAGNDMAVM